jgi:hypothetical protein
MCHGAFPPRFVSSVHFLSNFNAFFFSRSILNSILSEKAGNPEELGSGNNVGIFQNPDGHNEAVVFRLEFPATSLFGIPLGGSGSGPKIHFQMVKGSEVERRRSTLLRRRRRDSVSSDWRQWIPVRNMCAKVVEVSLQNKREDL